MLMDTTHQSDATRRTPLPWRCIAPPDAGDTVWDVAWAKVRSPSCNLRTWAAPVRRSCVVEHMCANGEGVGDPQSDDYLLVASRTLCNCGQGQHTCEASLWDVEAERRLGKFGTGNDGVAKALAVSRSSAASNVLFASGSIPAP